MDDRDHSYPMNGPDCGCIHRNNPKRFIGLRNAQLMAQKYPRSFTVPTRKQMAALKPGDFVKVCAAEGERFWMEVQKIGKEIEGAVANDLTLVELEFGDLISVLPENIYEILPQGQLAVVA